MRETPSTAALRGLRPRDSTGTMFLDMNEETGEIEVSYRNRQPTTALRAPPSHRNSTGTMFVDMNEETGEMQVSYRNRHLTANTQATNDVGMDLDMEIRERRRGDILVTGTDRVTGFEYDYNGRIVHVHRDNSRPTTRAGRGYAQSDAASTISEYYALDADNYETGIDILVREEEATGGEKKKRKKVTQFIKRLVNRFDSGGIFKKFKEWKAGSKKSASEHEKKEKNKLTDEYLRELGRSQSLSTQRRRDPPVRPPRTPPLAARPGSRGLQSLYSVMSRESLIPPPLNISSAAPARSALPTRAPAPRNPNRDIGRRSLTEMRANPWTWSASSGMGFNAQGADESLPASDFNVADVPERLRVPGKKRQGGGWL